jgi:hypothetical protein
MEEMEGQCIQVKEAGELTPGINRLLEEMNRSKPLIVEEYSRLCIYSKKLFENQLHYS